MIEPNLSTLRFLAEIGKRLHDWFKRPVVTTRRAPENIFEHLVPGTSLAKAREILGVPMRERDKYFSYKFKDAFVQINTKDGKSISAICMVLPKMRRRTTFRVFPLRFVLGKSSMAEAAWGEEPVYEYDWSSKHHEFRTAQYFGYDGNYLHYVFGVISAPHIYEPSVRWYSEGEGELGVVVSPPSEIIPNMACIVSGEPSEFHFDFWAFR